MTPIRDDHGRIVGYFLTVAELENILADWAKLKYPLEELERRAQEPSEGHTTAEILARLERV